MQAVGETFPLSLAGWTLEKIGIHCEHKMDSAFVERHITYREAVRKQVSGQAALQSDLHDGQDASPLIKFWHRSRFECLKGTEHHLA